MESKFRRFLIVALAPFCVFGHVNEIDAQQYPAAPVVENFGDNQPRVPNQIRYGNETQPDPQTRNQAVTPPSQDQRGVAVASPQYTPTDMMIRATGYSTPNQNTRVPNQSPTPASSSAVSENMSQVASHPKPATTNQPANQARPTAQMPHSQSQRSAASPPRHGTYQQVTYPHSQADVANEARGQANSSAVAYADESIDPIRALEDKISSMQCQLDAINSCGSCCEENQSCRGPGGLYFGAGVIFAKPHLKESFQYSQINFPNSQQTLMPFEYDYQSTLRAWIGYRSSEGFGFKVTYWGFDDEGQTSVNTADGMNIYGASAVTVIFPANIFAIAPGETLTNTDFLKTQIINYYGNYETKVGSFDVEGSLGLRYARLLQSLDSFVTPAAGGPPIRRLSWERKYDGLGPAISVDVKRQIGCSGFSVVGQGGGALLFGKKTINRVVIGDQSPQPATRTLVLDEADEVVGIGEMNFGLEWSHQFAGGRNLNIRGLYEGQLWAEAGAPTLGFLGFEGYGMQVEMTR